VQLKQRQTLVLATGPEVTSMMWRQTNRATAGSVTGKMQAIVVLA
jgi:hypothetical protein